MNERIITPDVPKPPSWLEDDAKRKWYELMGSIDRGRVRGAALDTLALYCQTYAAWRKSAEALQTQSIILKDQAGRVVANPHVQARDATGKQLNELAKQLGIRPDHLMAKVTPWEDVAAILADDEEEENDGAIPAPGDHSAGGQQAPRADPEAVLDPGEGQAGSDRDCGKRG
jgi:P27 family predicted phage terminase small subunit